MPRRRSPSATDGGNISSSSSLTRRAGHGPPTLVALRQQRRRSRRCDRRSRSGRRRSSPRPRTCASLSPSHRAVFLTAAAGPAAPKSFSTTITSHTSGPLASPARRPAGPSRNTTPGCSSIRMPSSTSRTTRPEAGSPVRVLRRRNRPATSSGKRTETGVLIELHCSADRKRGRPRSVTVTLRRRTATAPEGPRLHPTSTELARSGQHGRTQVRMLRTRKSLLRAYAATRSDTRRTLSGGSIPPSSTRRKWRSTRILQVVRDPCGARMTT